ncbi:uncharacterized protein LOC116589867 isoform X2 [Mustela erminea]|uniref:uncharacterized protein LOC116589867 isoform X2 n=1 Tax=Mustela erminea TaxID=36723 RepID=UPI0013870ABC|nr:uncharacterized protein LOC116589867 isoform X2 [Mustela erminea]
MQETISQRQPHLTLPRPPCAPAHCSRRLTSGPLAGDDQPRLSACPRRMLVVWPGAEFHKLVQPLHACVLHVPRPVPARHTLGPRMQARDLTRQQRTDRRAPSVHTERTPVAHKGLGQSRNLHLRSLFCRPHRWLKSMTVSGVQAAPSRSGGCKMRGASAPPKCPTGGAECRGPWPRVGVLTSPWTTSRAGTGSQQS